MKEEIDEWFFDKIDNKTGKFPNLLYKLISLAWFIPNNFIDKWYYRIFVRGICALKGCNITCSYSWYLPEDVSEWYCERCNAEGINQVVYTQDIFENDTPIRNFIKALRGE